MRESYFCSQLVAPEDFDINTSFEMKACSFLIPEVGEYIKTVFCN